jgi:hypothetical protein
MLGLFLAIQSGCSWFIWGEESLCGFENEQIKIKACGFLSGEQVEFPYQFLVLRL